MTLSSGTRLGSYEILAPIGAGGMGAVYKARDPHLDREVAIKVLSDTLARNPENLARFSREARMLAALSHPNIGAIYGVEDRDGTRFLVLELVGGENLTARLASGPLPVSEALEFARQILEALAAAHEKGIAHRDLKPSNVHVTPEGRAKVLDFGLAKAVAPVPGSSIVTSDSMTATGAVLGTPAYMSPEQARAQDVDLSTDLWSFGCLLFEMLTGGRVFAGPTFADCLAAILHDEPEWKRLPRSTPTAIRRLLQRCLDKDASRRPTAAEARAQIEKILEAPRRSRPPRTSTRTLTPRLTQLTLSRGLEESPVFSPAGDEMAYAADFEGVRKIFTRRSTGGGETPRTTGPFDDIQPAWSPDGATIAFVRARTPRRKLEPGDVFGAFWDGDIWTMDLETGRETRLVADAYNPSFSPDGKRIAFDAPWEGQRRIWSVDVQGHNPRQLTSDQSEAIAHVRPRWSPDGRRIVFQNKESTKFDVRVVELATQQLQWVTNDFFQDLQPVWSPSGRFIYFSSYRSGGLNLWRIPVSSAGKPRGVPQQLTTGAGQDLEPVLSADGSRLAFSIRRQNADLWTLPVDPATGRPAGAPGEAIATNREESRGAWSPDGRAIAFNSDRGGDMNIWVQEIGSAARQLTHGAGGDYQANWSPDGRTILFFSSRSGIPNIWSVEASSGEMKRLTESDSLDINPFFSPDGRFIAFQSDRSGRLEVWVMNADGSEPRALTRTGVAGHFLLWAKDSKSLLYRTPGGDSRTMRVSVEGGEPEPTARVAGGAHMSFSPGVSRVMDVVGHKELWVSPLGGGEPEKVFEFDDADARIDYPSWSPDGTRVLFDRFRPQGGDVWTMEGFE